MVMQVGGRLRRLDEAVWRRLRPAAGRPGDAAGDRNAAAGRQPAPTHRLRNAVAVLLGTVYQLARLVLLVLALVVVLGIVFTRAPTNHHNVLVHHVLQLAHRLAGPFRDIFTVKNRDNALTVNYGVAAAVYLLLAALVGRLPTGRRRP